MPEECLPPITPIEPGIAFCRCGRQMHVKASRLQEHLGFPGNEIIPRLLREGRCTAENVKEAMSEYDIFESWGLTYKCLECGVAHSNFAAQFTEEEAQEVVARNRE